MTDPKKYLKKVKLPNDSDIRWIRDAEAVHTDEIDSYLSDYLPLTGGTITGPLTATTITANTITATTITVSDLSVTNLDLGDIPAITTPISNVLTKDEDDDDKLKYHSTENFLEEIGGIGVVKVEDNVLTYELGKYREN